MTQAPTVAGPILHSRELDKLWNHFRRTHDQVTARRLFTQYLPLIGQVMAGLVRRLPAEVDPDDLMQEGAFGLMEAIERFDPSKNVKFTTFASARIRGAAYDYLRTIDWTPRIARSRARKVEAARNALRQLLGREPSDDELARHLNVEPDLCKRILDDSRLTHMVRVNSHADAGDEQDTMPGEMFQDVSAVDPHVSAQRRDLKDLITRGLSRPERLIVILYYYEHLTMREIGDTLDLSESRVSQLHSSILARLKAQLRHRDEELHIRTP